MKKLLPAFILLHLNTKFGNSVDIKTQDVLAANSIILPSINGYAWSLIEGERDFLSITEEKESPFLLQSQDQKSQIIDEIIPTVENDLPTNFVWNPYQNTYDVAPPPPVVVETVKEETQTEDEFEEDFPTIDHIGEEEEAEIEIAAEESTGVIESSPVQEEETNQISHEEQEIVVTLDNGNTEEEGNNVEGNIEQETVIEEHAIVVTSETETVEERAIKNGEESHEEILVEEMAVNNEESVVQEGGAEEENIVTPGDVVVTFVDKDQGSDI